MLPAIHLKRAAVEISHLPAQHTAKRTVNEPQSDTVNLYTHHNPALYSIRPLVVGLGSNQPLAGFNQGLARRFNKGQFHYAFQRLHCIK